MDNTNYFEPIKDENTYIEPIRNDPEYFEPLRNDSDYFEPIKNDPGYINLTGKCKVVDFQVTSKCVQLTDNADNNHPSDYPIEKVTLIFWLNNKSQVFFCIPDIFNN